MPAASSDPTAFTHDLLDAVTRSCSKIMSISVDYDLGSFPKDFRHEFVFILFLRPINLLPWLDPSIPKISIPPLMFSESSDAILSVIKIDILARFLVKKYILFSLTCELGDE